MSNPDHKVELGPSERKEVSVGGTDRQSDTKSGKKDHDTKGSLLGSKNGPRL